METDKKKIIEEFENIKDKSELKSLSDLSLERTLTDREHKRAMELSEKLNIFIK